MGRVLPGLCLALLVLAGPGWGGVAVPAPEDLSYRISLGPWQEAARVNVTLKQEGPERYLAEFSGAARGMWTLLSRWLPESYQTEMELFNGRLRPLVYRELIRVGGKQVLKEYRFDYRRGLLEYWRRVEGQAFSKRWQVPLNEPVYDVLTLFYNIRLGGFGSLLPGQTLTVKTIPTPEPEELLISFGPQTAQGSKVMIVVRESSGSERGPYFLFMGPEGVPREAWTRVLTFGKLTGHLLDSQAIRKKNGGKFSQLPRENDIGKQD